MQSNAPEEEIYAATHLTSFTADRPVLTVEETVRLEQEIAAAGTPLKTLMRRAGTSLANFICTGCARPMRILVLCGSGNNGGDGWVAASLLAARGHTVNILSTRKVEDITAEPAASTVREIATQCRFAEEVGDQLLNDQVFRYTFRDEVVTFEQTNMIFDCLLGTGFQGEEVRGASALLIERANETKAQRVACDVPSGLSANTGKPAQPCFRADATVTMLAAKQGLVQSQAAPFVGTIFLALLGFFPIQKLLDRGEGVCS